MHLCFQLGLFVMTLDKGPDTHVDWPNGFSNGFNDNSNWRQRNGERVVTRRSPYCRTVCCRGLIDTDVY